MRRSRYTSNERRSHNPSGERIVYPFTSYQSLRVVQFNLQPYHFTIITGQSDNSETRLALLPKILSLFGLLSSIDKLLLPIMMKSTFSVLATFTMPSGVDPITSVERTLTPCFFAS
jgi:hypothetical protein